MRARPVGEHALLLEADDAGQLRALHAHVTALRRTPELSHLTDVVPGARTLLLDGLDDPQVTAEAARGWMLPPVPAATHGLIELDVIYDGEDLPAVARHWDLDVAAAAARHAAITHTVAFCGFAPGFAYMTGLPRDLAVPRRPTPRPHVPAGAVALAGPYTGVYPQSSPGGWQLIGHTDARLWDPDRDPPALLAPGSRVRFRARA